MKAESRTWHSTRRLRAGWIAIAALQLAGPAGLCAAEALLSSDQEVTDALAKAQPGDALVLRTGFYKGGWALKPGAPDKPITFRAEGPGRAFVGSLDTITGFDPVKGFEYAHAVPYPTEPEKLRELDTGKELRWMATPMDVEEVVGAYCYEKESQRLFVHPTDSAGTGHHTYAPVPSTNGLLVASHTVVDGLVMTGFGGAAIKGDKVTGVTIQNCKLYRNGSAIVFGESQKCIVRNNECWENRPDYSQGAQISFLGSTRGMLVEGNRVHGGLGDHNGIFIYSGDHRDNIFRRNLLWNVNGATIKGAGTNNLAEYNVCMGGLGTCVMRHNTYVCPVLATPDRQTDLILSEFKANMRFADVGSQDFRLQSNSGARGKGDAPDLGAFPYRGDVFFVDPEGNDEADGTSEATAWKTLAHAVRALDPGQTLYICPGRYDEAVLLNGKPGLPDQKTCIRVHGRGKATVSRVEVHDSAGLEVAGLRVTGSRHPGFSIKNSSDVTLLKCASYGNAGGGVVASECRELRLRRCAVWGNAGPGLSLVNCADAELVSSIVAGNATSQLSFAATRDLSYYGEFNAFSEPVARPVATVEGPIQGDLGLGEWQKLCGSDTQSTVLTEGLAGPDKGDFRVPPGTRLAVAGLYYSPPGPDGLAHQPIVRATAIERVEVVSVTSTSANILWYTPGRMCGTVLQWGPTGALENMYDRGSDPNHSEYELVHTVSLVGLKPDTRYYFRPGYADFGTDENHVLWDLRVHTFTTAAADPEPRALFVARDGDDANDGLSRKTAWRTLHKAAREARAGDTVTILPGRYPELLRPLQTGTSEDRRITFRGGRPLSIFLDGGMIRHKRPGRPHNVQLHGKAFITIENITGEKCSENIDYGGYRGGWGYAGIFRTSGGAMNEFRNCVADARYRWMSGFVFFEAGHIAGIENPEYAARVTDSVTLGCWRAVQGFSVAPLLLEHNIYFVTMTGMHSVHCGPGRWVSRNCIYQDHVKGKRQWGGIPVFGNTEIVDSDYCSFAWMPDSKKTVARAGNRRDGELIAGLDAWQKASRKDAHSVEHTPQYPLTKLELPNGRFDHRPLRIDDVILPEDSPLRGKGTEGSDIGVRWDKWLTDSKEE